MNSLKLYEIALTEKLKSIFPNVKYASPDEAFNSSNNKGKVKLPLITAYRVENPAMFGEMDNFAEKFRGRMTSHTDLTSTNYMTVAVNLSYQIDIWANDRESLDGLYCELIFYMIRYPNLEITLDKFSKLSFAMMLTDSESMTDTSSFDELGRLYHMSLTYEIPTAKLFYPKNVTYDKPITDSNGVLINGSMIPYTVIDLNDNNTDS